MRWKQRGAARVMATGIPALASEEVEYPSRDGRPMAETDAHRDEMMAAIGSLKARYADRDDVYVAGDLFIYYEEGNPKARFAPDVFVIFGVPNHRRRVYKLWEEGVVPAFVLEVSSRGTWLEDAGEKRAICEKLGVAEYFLFDPEADYLDPPLQAFRRVGRQLQRLEPDERGGFVSETLGLSLYLEDLRLVMTDLETGVRLLRLPEEHVARQAAEAAQRKAEAAQREAEAAQRKAEARAREAEEEVARLRAELAKRGR